MHLKQLTHKEALAIRTWPAYPSEYALLDYALRKGGWLDLFPANDRNARYGIRQGRALLGFTMLVDMEHGAAEFYIAIHPDHLGAGVGGKATHLTLEEAFRVKRLDRVYLKVRVWHAKGIHLYAKHGFVPQGEVDETANGELVRFLKMEVKRADRLTQQGGEPKAP